MNCDVFDMYVTRANGQIMHFDVIVPSGTPPTAVQTFGQSYLTALGVLDGKVTAERCRFCHVEQATAEIQQAVEAQGYFIVALEGCPLVANSHTIGG